MQYPHMVFYLKNNPQMDIAKVIGANLTALMASHPGLDTFKKIAARSGVGFGTVQRAKNGDGNITVEKLTAIALAFGRHPAELMIPDGACQGGEAGRYPKAVDADALRLVAQDAAAVVVRIGSPLRDELAEIAERINDGGLHELIGEARQIAKRYPRADTGNAAR